MKNKLFIAIAALMVLAAVMFVVFSKGETRPTDEHAHAEADGHGHDDHAHDDHAEGKEPERGPRNGRLLVDGDFAIELTIFEDGVPPQFRVYAYEQGKPIAPADIKVTIELTRLGGEISRFVLTPEGDALTNPMTVEEPHSFDMKVTAERAGKSHEWAYESYEGRTTIDAKAAEASGLETEVAGPATIREMVNLTGRIVLDPNATARVKARFRGIVRDVKKQLGEAVAAGEVLAIVESNDSLQAYPVKAPIAGIVIARDTNPGDVAGDEPIFTIADLSQVWAELHVFPRDIDRVAVGQKLHLTAALGTAEAEATVTALPPIAEANNQTVVARVSLDNREGRWRVGMGVRADVIVSERQAPLAVKLSALQRFRDFTVVFARVGQTYEVRMLELGAKDDLHAEVLGGLKLGTEYVSKNSFLIKADIEKSGASHDH